MPIPTDITDDTIRAFRSEAGEAGDYDSVAYCNSALLGCAECRQTVADTLQDCRDSFPADEPYIDTPEAKMNDHTHEATSATTEPLPAHGGTWTTESCPCGHVRFIATNDQGEAITSEWHQPENIAPPLEA